MAGDGLSVADWHSCFSKLESAEKRARELVQRPLQLITHKAAFVFDEQDRAVLSRFLRHGWTAPSMISFEILHGRDLPPWVTLPGRRRKS
jgi:hypothetical protein